jgi:rare lipoprotein A
MPFARPWIISATVGLSALSVVPVVADGFVDGRPMQATMATLLETAEPWPPAGSSPEAGDTDAEASRSADPAPAAAPADEAPEAAVLQDSQPPAAAPAPAPAPQPAGPRVVKVITGEASWYGPGFFGNRTASGEVFRPGTITAAHRTLPFGTRVRVTNLWNGRSTVVRINDRGPFTGNRVIDLAHGAAGQLGLISSGIAQVKLEVLQ